MDLWLAALRGTGVIARRSLVSERQPSSRPDVSAMPVRSVRPWRFTLTVGMALAAGTSHAASAVTERSEVDHVFVQIGAAKDVQTIVIGAARDWTWSLPLGDGVLTGYWEASFGRWNSKLDDRQHASAWVTQIGLTPVLRWQPSSSSEEWFFEAGVGANVLLPVFRSRDKRFSTAFNFGDHIALGSRFGSAGEHEIALRLQHFSNAGIRHPNPGENFLQLRYSWRY